MVSGRAHDCLSELMEEYLVIDVIGSVCVAASKKKCNGICYDQRPELTGKSTKASDKT